MLVDGVREGRVWDERGGFRLVVGEGTVALVGPEGHVRASHRVSFSRDDVVATFLDDGQAIVGNGGTDAAFRGPHGGRLERWRLDDDAFEVLAELGDITPSMARVGEGVVIVVAEAGTSRVTASAFEALGQSADRIACTSGARPRCYLGFVEGDRWRIELAEDDAIDFVEDAGRVPPALRPRALPRSGPMSSQLGARGLPEVDLAPARHRLVVSSSSRSVVLGPEGIGADLDGANARWERDELLIVAGHDRPMDVATASRVSVFVDAIPHPLERDEVELVEVRDYDDWQAVAYEAESADRPIPVLRAPPVCSRAPPLRCVRAHTDGARIDGWELYDPRRSREVLARLPFTELPPGQGYVLVAPGGAYVRAVLGEASLFETSTGRVVSGLHHWLELDEGWIYVDPEEEHTLRLVSFDGRTTSRTFTQRLAGLSLVDGHHVFIRDVEGTGAVLAWPDLTTVRTLELGEPVEELLGCNARGAIVDASGRVVEDGGCPVAPIDDEAGRLVRVTRDHGWWLDRRLGDELHVHRGSDGAELVVRLTTAGVLASGPGGVFEGRGEVLDHVVVREVGPVRTAPITTGSSARARFERPGLVAAFFSGAPLPAPGEAPIAEQGPCPDRPPTIDASCAADATGTACRYPERGVICACRAPAPRTAPRWDCGELGE
ncbi:MAG: hypothetical protein K1X94_25080 [Sandaracinaceae bacterium]|nr:hypothetical protein [Sandaracinaceae bacterium]